MDNSAPTNNVPPMLVITRHGCGIQDERWLEHRQLLLAAVTAPALLAQTDQNFTWLIVVDPDMPARARARLEEIVEPFGDKAVLSPTGDFTNRRVLLSGKELGMARDGYSLSGRTDDDDAWHPETVAIIRKTAGRWLARAERSDALLMTFQLGYEWLMHDLVDIRRSKLKGRTIELKSIIHPFRMNFQGDSVFVISRDGTDLTCRSAPHGKMGVHFEELGKDIEYLLPDKPMWLYTRHKQVATNFLHGPLVDAGLTVDEICTMFNLDTVKIKEYIKSSDQFEYLLDRDMFKQRDERQAALEEVERTIRSGQGTPELAARADDLRSELDRLKRNLVGPI